MPGPVPGGSATRVRRIFPTPKSKRGRTRRLSFRKFHRDAGQDRVTHISRKEKTRSLPRSGAARNLYAALHDGHVYADPLRNRRASRADSRRSGLCRLDRCDELVGRISRQATALESKLSLTV